MLAIERVETRIRDSQEHRHIRKLGQASRAHFGFTRNAKCSCRSSRFPRSLSCPTSETSISEMDVIEEKDEYALEVETRMKASLEWDSLAKCKILDLKEPQYDEALRLIKV